MICHLVSREEWAAGAAGYRPPSLETEGFIHFSAPEQVLDTANRYYRGRTDLLLVVVDPERLTAELRWEPPARPADGNGGAAGHGTASGSAASDGQGEARYPHLYGPIDPDAVVTIVPFAPDSDGRFTAMPVLA